MLSDHSTSHVEMLLPFQTADNFVNTKNLHDKVPQRIATRTLFGILSVVKSDAVHLSIEMGVYAV